MNQALVTQMSTLLKYKLKVVFRNAFFLAPGALSVEVIPMPDRLRKSVK